MELRSIDVSETITDDQPRELGTLWPDTTSADLPRDHPYRAATWLLGRHPRLAALAARVCDVVYVDRRDGELSIDIDHLGEVFAAGMVYSEAWDEYEHDHSPPQDEDAYYSWQEAGPRADDFAAGLSDLVVMSSGEVASLRLLATLGATRIPFKLADLCSLDAEGQRLLSDWCRVVMRG